MMWLDSSLEFVSEKTWYFDVPALLNFVPYPFEGVLFLEEFGRIGQDRLIGFEFFSDRFCIVLFGFECCSDCEGSIASAAGYGQCHGLEVAVDTAVIDIIFVHYSSCWSLLFMMNLLP